MHVELNRRKYSTQWEKRNQEGQKACVCVGAVQEVGWGGGVFVGLGKRKLSVAQNTKPQHFLTDQSERSKLSTCHIWYVHTAFSLWGPHVVQKSRGATRGRLFPPLLHLTTNTMKPDSFKHPSKSSVSYCMQILVLQHKYRIVLYKQIQIGLLLK